MEKIWFSAVALAVPSFWHDSPELALVPEADEREHEYSPDALTMMSTGLLLPAVGVVTKARPLGGWTAYTTVAGELPVVTYVASNVTPWLALIVLVKVSI